MNIYIYIISILICFISCNKELTEEELLHKTDPIGLYGEKITLKNYINIDKIITNPVNYIDKEVLVSGVIENVCPMRGCWIDIKEEKSDKIIKVKVKDGNIVFPISAKNFQVKVQGVVTKIVYTEEQAINWKKHLAEEQGVILDADSIQIVESDLIEYRINSKRAEIFK